MREGRVQSTPASLNADGARIALIVSRFNREITDALLDGARACLLEHGADEATVDVFRVPGAWELVGAAQRAVQRGGYDALVALGCIVRGETPHFEYISGAAAHGLNEVARLATVPVTFGVLTTDTVEQARARAGAGAGNKGREAAMSAIEMIAVYRRLANGRQGA